MRRLFQKLLLAMVIGLVPFGVCVAASFDCSRVTSNVAQLICNDPGLSAKDEQLAVLYARVKSAYAYAPAQLAQIAAAEQGWLKETYNSCDDVDCINTAYDTRISQLNSLLPQAQQAAQPAAESQPAPVQPAQTQNDADQGAAVPAPQIQTAQQPIQAAPSAAGAFAGVSLAMIAVGLFVLFCYFIPTIIAVARKHRQMPAIAAVNFFFGWSGIGWILSLIWALTAPDNRSHQTGDAGNLGMGSPTGRGFTLDRACVRHRDRFPIACLALYDR